MALSKPTGKTITYSCDLCGDDDTVFGTSNPGGGGGELYVKLISDQTVDGVKTFLAFPLLPNTDPTLATQATNKKYVDEQIAAIVIPTNPNTTKVHITDFTEADYVHIAGVEIITGNKTFSGLLAAPAVTTDIVAEKTADNGIAIDGYLIKDGQYQGTTQTITSHNSTNVLITGDYITITDVTSVLLPAFLPGKKIIITNTYTSPVTINVNNSGTQVIHSTNNVSGTSTSIIIPPNTSWSFEARNTTTWTVEQFLGIGWNINTSGHFEPILDDTYDIGSSNKPRNISAGQDIASNRDMTVGRWLHLSNSSGQTATGSSQSDGFSIGGQITNFSTVPSNTGGRLDITSTGVQAIVFNNGANPLNIYPASGLRIDGLSSNAPVIMPAGTSRVFTYLSGDGWRSQIFGDSTYVHITGNENIAGNKTFSGNTVLSGTLDSSSSATINTINEHTVDSGVTVEGVLIKDNNITVPDSPSDSHQAINKTYADTLYTPIADDVKTIKVAVSSSDILGLNSTPKVLIAAPGSGKFVDILNIALHFKYGTTAYSSSFGVAYVGNTAGLGSGQSLAVAHGLNGASSYYSHLNFTWADGSDNDFNINEAVILTGGPFTLGDSSIDFYITYKVITL